MDGKEVCSGCEVIASQNGLLLEIGIKNVELSDIKQFDFRTLPMGNVV